MNTQVIAGMDEAGRGSWAGPVVAAAVILPKNTKLPGLTDSKLLTAKKREELFAKITKKCEFGIGEATQQEVDELGLTAATEKAFQRAHKNLPKKPDHLLIDGRDKFHFEVPHTPIIKGDLKKRCISAASVLAKVHRDRLMLEYAKKYPHYGFDAHKGYGTARHLNAIKKHGKTNLHRHSYAPIKRLKCSQNEY
jgi:ribonuclease HII